MFALNIFSQCVNLVCQRVRNHKLTDICLLSTYLEDFVAQKQVTNGKFYVFASFRLFFGDFVAEGDEITGRRTVYHE